MCDTESVAAAGDAAAVVKAIVARDQAFKMHKNKDNSINLHSYFIKNEKKMH